MDARTRALVRERAGDRCEYCQLPQEDSPLAVLHIEHLLPKIHGGTDDMENLALACIDCNLHKAATTGRGMAAGLFFGKEVQPLRTSHENFDRVNLRP